ncbi:uncharacterized protein [Macaca nemestrina]|uniref:uncharacterized protein isoform X2 n=1 Tax=Macaca nemestrina TaxID=9545 RepID=UPI0039B91595
MGTTLTCRMCTKASPWQGRRGVLRGHPVALTSVSGRPAKAQAPAERSRDAQNTLVPCQPPAGPAGVRWAEPSCSSEIHEVQVGVAPGSTALVPTQSYSGAVTGSALATRRAQSSLSWAELAAPSSCSNQGSGVPAILQGTLRTQEVLGWLHQSCRPMPISRGAIPRATWLAELGLGQDFCRYHQGNMSSYWLRMSPSPQWYPKDGNVYTDTETLQEKPRDQKAEIGLTMLQARGRQGLMATVRSWEEGRRQLLSLSLQL